MTTTYCWSNTHNTAIASNYLTDIAFHAVLAILLEWCDKCYTFLYCLRTYWWTNAMYTSSSHDALLVWYLYKWWQYVTTANNAHVYHNTHSCYVFMRIVPALYWLVHAWIVRAPAAKNVCMGSDSKHMHVGIAPTRSASTMSHPHSANILLPATQYTSLCKAQFTIGTIMHTMSNFNNESKLWNTQCTFTKCMLINNTSTRVYLSCNGLQIHVTHTHSQFAMSICPYEYTLFADNHSTHTCCNNANHALPVYRSHVATNQCLHFTSKLYK